MNETCWVIIGSEVKQVSVAYRGNEYVVTRTANGAELSHRVGDVFADEIHALRELNRRLNNQLAGAVASRLATGVSVTPPWCEPPKYPRW